MRFPDSFLWGAATSAYQIEGGREEGKGTSIWDTFAHTPGKTYLGQTGDSACDHYHRFAEDVELMARLGIDVYRFSIAWSRVLPEGIGAANPNGLGFYDRLVDDLVAHRIQPWVTIFHWDLPQSLQDQGGWANRETVAAFAEFTRLLGDTLADRVFNWITINEPWVAAFLGHYEGIHAPGVTEFDTALVAAHNLLLSHGKAATTLRERNPDARVGIALDCRPSQPASDSLEDREAQRHFDGFRNRWFFDPVFGRGYPADMLEDYRKADRSLDFIREGDLESMAPPIDFLGVNYYTSLAVGAGREESEEPVVAPGPNPPEGFTEMGWEITPEALPRYLWELYERYHPSQIIVTENGASYSDGPDANGVVNDQRRIDYLHRHVEALAQAIDDGLPVGGYFCWSLLDNFEWGHGFSQRFGLVWVDFETQTRIPKASFEWYRRTIKASR